MISRRTLTTSGLAALTALPFLRRTGAAAQSSESTLEFTGPIAHQNLPELPTAPDGEVGVVMQSLGNGVFVPAIYHNATDAAVRVTEVTAVAVDVTGNEVDETSFGPINLEPGQYGFAVFEFDDELPEGTEVSITISTEEDAEMVDISVTNVVFEEAAGKTYVHITVDNPHEFEVDDTVIAGIFFTAEGELLSGLATDIGIGVDAGDSFRLSFSRSDLSLSDSFVFAASARTD